ncbi:ACT domain-containing protein [Neisseriaceae bacterium ESL0693]|nr:ACT domain-containing protein [Neisseriaceae bacterium ESL0693]
MTDYSVLTVIGKDRIGIVAEVATFLAQHQINIINISQQLMDDYFTMIILVDLAECPQNRTELTQLLMQQSKATALDIRLQDQQLFNAMYRI